VAANDPSTFWTTPFCLFLFQELLYAMYFYEFKVFYHAHVVLCAVTPIQRFQSRAWKNVAFKAESNVAFSKQFTAIPHVGAMFSSRDAAGAVFLVKPLFVHIFFPELKSNTQTAVHPAWGNGCFFHRDITPSTGD